ncbi:FtsK/SpoIIIE domain-containing protein [Dactylosporangium siamense]|uniref:FtsK domain-containing protein n=1 Tax=Dactylosporangium siamense TaxID=685454 RepID=A0A919PXJ6_9ACTN|nr:FtsK/SpoIIIE domain-containing protein [Dactylosporangium siamense]GIG51512.1 hypothetical protein Dsi01nite_095530 [Dactylosporangium siamense]
MTTAWVRASPVAARLAAARSRLPAGALELACHAAVAVAVDAGLLHLLRINFFLDPPTVLPFEAEAALLLSPLFREVGEDLYEIDPALRDALLAALTARFGPERPARVAVLLEQYTDQHPAWHLQPELEHAQRLTALNLVDPARAADWLATNRTSAGGPALTREWFVAMTGRLRPRASLPDRLADAVAAADAPSHELRAAAVAELGELALLPGADVRAIALQLERVARVDDGPVRDLAAEVLDTVKRLVPPPLARGISGGPDDTYPAASFPALHGIDPPTFDPARAWTGADGLTAAIGVDPDGRPVGLYLGGIGSHCLVVGTAGAGKSELLRTLILGLAVHHSPAELNILPVDLRGGATFAGLESLPHLAGLAVDSGDLMSLIERLKEVVLGEIARRQQPFTGLRPRLLIVVDEFGSLLTADPTLVDTFTSIGRLGRQVGIHLVVACERLDSGHLRDLDAHLSVRIALRAFSEHESQLAIGTPDAAGLPPRPGHGFLRAIDGRPRRFRAAYVSDVHAASWDDILAPRPDSLLDVLVRRMAGHGTPVHQIWLPPLPAVLALGDLPADGVTIGEVDMPREHRRGPFTIDVSGASGHVAIVGEPRSGRTTALRTVVAALSRSAQHVSVYCIGADLGPLEDAPVVVNVFDPRHHRDAVTELIAFLRFSSASDTVLIIDGWAHVVRSFPSLGDLVSAGRAVIVAADERWSRFRIHDLAAFGTTVELRLDEPETSRISVPAARSLRYEPPGRALVAGGLRLQIALPVGQVGGDPGTYLRELAAARVDQPYPRIRLGTFEPGGEEFTVDFTTDPHLLVVGASPGERLAVRQAIERSVAGQILGPHDTARVVEELQRSPDGVRTPGPDLWVIAEDVLAPLAALRDFLPYARALRLRVVAFAPLGASDEIVRVLTDLATPTITLSGALGELSVPDQVPRRIRLDPPTVKGASQPVPFAVLHGIDPATFDPEQAWAGPANLAVPVGTDPDGRPVRLDLRGASEGGTGPHGLVAAAAGTGTSEVLRSLVLGLAVSNGPAALNILAVDFGDGTTFAGLESLPHLVGLAVDDVPRLMDAVLGEIARRQDRPTGPIPRLLIVVDEFDRLLDAQPAAVNTLLQVLRAGRVLGIHLLLAAGRLQERRLIGLDPYLTFRIEIDPPEARLTTTADDRVHRFRGPQLPGAVEALVARMAGRGGPVHQILLPALPAVVALGDLPDHGVAVGLIDLPNEHRQEPLVLDLAVWAGHTAIVGERGSGTTTALQTVVTAIARQGTPYHVYCLGGGLNTVAGLPYVGGVFHRNDGPAIARLVAFLRHRPLGTGSAMVVVIIDNLPRVARDHPEVLELLTIAQVHVVATATGWSAFSAEVFDTFGTVVELRLEVPETSQLSVDGARQVPGGLPGRGLLAGGRVQIAAPVRRVGGNHHEYVAELANAWTGPPAPRVEPDLRLRIGTHEDDGSDCVLDFAEHPHLLIRAVGEVLQRLTAAVAGFADGQVFGGDDAGTVADLLRGRLPGPNVPARHLLTRAWWTGPELWVIVTADTDALDALVEFLPQGRELGFHLITVDEGVAGNRAAAIGRLHELGAPTITSYFAAPFIPKLMVEQGGQERLFKLDL